MATKSKSKSKKTTKTKTQHVANAIDARKELLAKVAGSVAAGLVTSPSPSIAKPESMATVAVDLAEEILKRAGIPSTEVVADAPAASSGGAAVGAAS